MLSLAFHADAISIVVCRQRHDRLFPGQEERSRSRKGMGSTDARQRALQQKGASLTVVGSSGAPVEGQMKKAGQVKGLPEFAG